MATTFTVRGYVQDAVTGAPIANAVTNVYAHTDANAAGALLGTDPATDANGLFEITGITAQQVDVEITNAGQTYWWKGYQSMSLGDVYINKVLVGASGLLLPNNISVSGTTTGGTDVSLLAIGGDDNIYVHIPTGKGLVVQNQTSSANALVLDDTGNVAFTGGVTQSLTTPGNIPVKLSTATITPNVTTSVTFGPGNTLTQNFKHLRVTGQVRWGTGSTFANLLGFRINGLSSSIYTYNNNFNWHQTPSQGTNGYVALCPSDNIPGKYSLVFDILFTNYADTNLYKTANVFGSTNTDSTYAGFGSEVDANTIETTAAITMIEFKDYTSGWTFGSGSNIELWGIP